MKSLLSAGRFLAEDMASTLFFLALYMLTRNAPLSIALGMALGIAQICWQYATRKPIDTMQWMSLVLVIGSGAATLLTHDPRFVMVKPSLIYAVVGFVMLKPGWMVRYLPPIAMEVAPDVAAVFGYIWSGLMFFSAILNLVLAASMDLATWVKFMSLWGVGSKLALFLVQYATMRAIGFRRRRAGLIPA